MLVILIYWNQLPPPLTTQQLNPVRPNWCVEVTHLQDSPHPFKCISHLQPRQQLARGQTFGEDVMTAFCRDCSSLSISHRWSSKEGVTTTTATTLSKYRSAPTPLRGLKMTGSFPSTRDNSLCKLSCVFARWRLLLRAHTIMNIL